MNLYFLCLETYRGNISVLLGRFGKFDPRRTNMYLYQLSPYFWVCWVRFTPYIHTVTVIRSIGKLIPDLCSYPEMRYEHRVPVFGDCSSSWWILSQGHLWPSSRRTEGGWGREGVGNFPFLNYSLYYSLLLGIHSKLQLSGEGDGE